MIYVWSLGSSLNKTLVDVYSFSLKLKKNRLYCVFINKQVLPINYFPFSLFKTVSSLVFFFVVIVLLSIIYRKDPHCCKHGSYQDPHADMVSCSGRKRKPWGDKVSFVLSFLLKVIRTFGPAGHADRKKCVCSTINKCQIKFLPGCGERTE